MNENDFDLSAALEQLMKNHNRGNILVEGTVIAVNDDYTCDVKIGEITQYSVPLKVVTNSQASVYEIPVVNTGCLITFRDGNLSRPQIVVVDQVDQLLINCSTIVEFNGGDKGGLINVVDLVTRLNKVESDINNLKSVFSGWTPVPNDGGSALKAQASSWASDSLIPTKRTDIEDTKITH